MDTLAKVLVLITLLPLLIFHFWTNRKFTDQILLRSRTRKSILDQIIKTYPRLPEKVVFYTESDTAFYGLPPEERIMPFQSGFGQTLLVWYFNQGENWPACFFKPEDDFLFAITEEGYRECSGRGFGYFRNFNLLQETLVENNLSKENVIAFVFKLKYNELIDVTRKVRENL